MQMMTVQLLPRVEGDAVILISSGAFYSVMKMQIAPSCRAEMEPEDGVAPAAARSKSPNPGRRRGQRLLTAHTQRKI